jgi:hypothetical protein
VLLLLLPLLLLPQPQHHRLDLQRLTQHLLRQLLLLHRLQRQQHLQRHRASHLLLLLHPLQWLRLQLLLQLAPAAPAAAVQRRQSLQEGEASAGHLAAAAAASAGR